MLHDFRFTVRAFRRSPGFFCGAVLILALGIGLSTATFSVFYNVLIRRLGVVDQDRLVTLAGDLPGSRLSVYPLHRRLFRAFQRETRTLSAVAGLAYDGPWAENVEDPNSPNRSIAIHSSVVTGNFFDVLGTKAEIGRVLTVHDDEPGAAGTIVISHDFWQREYGGDSSVIGRRLLDREIGRPYTIVGVMPPDLTFERGADAWRMLDAQFPVLADSDLDNRFALLRLVGRLAPGASMTDARGELDAFLRRAERPRASLLARLTATARPFTDEVVGDVRPALRIIAAAVGLLLLITCVNVASLLLIRGAIRGPELAVRASLGASRWRLARQMLIEGALLALAGGLLGVLLAAAALHALVAIAPAQLPRVAEARIDATTLFAAVVISAMTVVLFALGPAVSLSPEDLFSLVRSGARSATGTGGSRRGRQVLVVVQFALALVVLVAAGLLARSLAGLQRLDLGLDPTHVALIELHRGADPNATAGSINDRVDELRAAIETLPGVASVATGIQVPFTNAGIDATVSAEGEAETERAKDPFVTFEFVSPNYFNALSIRVLAGRSFDEADRSGSTPVAVLSQRVAEHYWPGRGAVGRRISCAANVPCTVVGVVAETRYRNLVAPHPAMYRPGRQAPDVVFAPRVLLVRTSGDPASVAGAVRVLIAHGDPTFSIGYAGPMRDLLGAPLARPRLNAALMSVFALAALVLACAGIFGVVTFHIAQRTRELGIRQALGATPAQLRTLVLREGVALEACGVGVGLVVALAGMQTVRALLFAVSPADPLAVSAAIVILLMCGLAAAAIPARRAALVEPAVALRAE